MFGLWCLLNLDPTIKFRNSRAIYSKWSALFWTQNPFIYIHIYTHYSIFIIIILHNDIFKLSFERDSFAVILPQYDSFLLNLWADVFLSSTLGRGWKWSHFDQLSSILFRMHKERERENRFYSLIIHYILHYAPKHIVNVAEKCLAQGFFKTFPLLHPCHLLTSFLLPLAVIFIFMMLAVASSAAVPALGCPKVQRWDLTRRWLTSLSLTKQQQCSRCQTLAGRVEGGGCQHFGKVEYKST